jgi:hypothetical protein
MAIHTVKEFQEKMSELAAQQVSLLYQEEDSDSAKPLEKIGQILNDLKDSWRSVPSFPEFAENCQNNWGFILEMRNLYNENHPTAPIDIADACPFPIKPIQQEILSLSPKQFAANPPPPAIFNFFSKSDTTTIEAKKPAPSNNATETAPEFR